MAIKLKKWDLLLPITRLGLWKKNSPRVPSTYDPKLDALAIGARAVRADNKWVSYSPQTRIFKFKTKHKDVPLDYTPDEDKKILQAESREHAFALKMVRKNNIYVPTKIVSRREVHQTLIDERRRALMMDELGDLTSDEIFTIRASLRQRAETKEHRWLLNELQDVLDRKMLEI